MEYYLLAMVQVHWRSWVLCDCVGVVAGVPLVSGDAE